MVLARKTIFAVGLVTTLPNTYYLYLSDVRGCGKLALLPTVYNLSSQIISDLSASDIEASQRDVAAHVVTSANILFRILLNGNAASAIRGR